MILPSSSRSLQRHYQVITFIDTQGAEETMTLAEKHRPPVFSQSELTLFSCHRNTRLTAGFHFTENFCGTRLLFNNKTWHLRRAPAHMQILTPALVGQNVVAQRYRPNTAVTACVLYVVHYEQNGSSIAQRNWKQSMLFDPTLIIIQVTTTSPPSSDCSLHTSCRGDDDSSRETSASCVFTERVKVVLLSEEHTFDSWLSLYPKLLRNQAAFFFFFINNNNKMWHPFTWGEHLAIYTNPDISSVGQNASSGVTNVVAVGTRKPVRTTWGARKPLQNNSTTQWAASEIHFYPILLSHCWLSLRTHLRDHRYNR